MHGCGCGGGRTTIIYQLPNLVRAVLLLRLWEEIFSLPPHHHQGNNNNNNNSWRIDLRLCEKKGPKNIRKNKFHTVEPSLTAQLPPSTNDIVMPHTHTHDPIEMLMLMVNSSLSISCVKLNINNKRQMVSQTLWPPGTKGTKTKTKKQTSSSSSWMLNDSIRPRLYTQSPIKTTYVTTKRAFAGKTGVLTYKKKKKKGKLLLR